ncbi:hypothetical protein [Actinophytocola sp.]|uniref:hypothetical protein n=1 Tax=Actinophytocola sp. TaxID=1872138 RepID=UPI002D808E50|nr:hypothetical protein [Actinophytocola sp.]HET9142323.1 hypothetical protein [Actinophytocola sp.]
MNPMLFLGLLLVVASAAATALLVAYNSSGGPEQTVVLFGQDLATVTPLQAFVSGLVISLVFCVGVWMMTAASKRSRAVRSEYRTARREARDVARERDQLAEELAKERAANTVDQERAADVRTERVVTERTEPEVKPTPQERGRTLAERFRRNRTTETAAVDDTAHTR